MRGADLLPQQRQLRRVEGGGNVPHDPELFEEGGAGDGGERRRYVDVVVGGGREDGVEVRVVEVVARRGGCDEREGGVAGAHDGDGARGYGGRGARVVGC